MSEKNVIVVDSRAEERNPSGTNFYSLLATELDTSLYFFYSFNRVQQNPIEGNIDAVVIALEDPEISYAKIPKIIKRFEEYYSSQEDSIQFFCVDVYDVGLTQTPQSHRDPIEEGKNLEPENVFYFLRGPEIGEVDYFVSTVTDIIRKLEGRTIQGI